MRKLIAILLLGLGLPVMALDKIPFDKAVFDKAQEEGVPVLVDIYAKWCPTCERQQIILSRYFEENPNSPIQVMEVDFDQDKEWVKYFKAPRQSTLYIYQDGERVWFSVAQTSTRVIESALDEVAE